MKTSELTGAALDWAVAVALGHKDIITDFGAYIRIGTQPAGSVTFCPSTDWAQGGPIIEREKLAVWFSEAVHDENGVILREPCWYCETSCTTDNGDEPYKCETAPTPLIAAMRCYVASKLGDEVELPEELS